MTFPTDPNSQPQDPGVTAQQPVAPEGYQAPQQYGPPPQTGNEAVGYGQGYAPYAVPPTSTGQGLSSAALILAILFWPVGLILSIIAVIKARPKGLAIAALIISVVFGIICAILLAVGAVALTASSDKTSSAEPAATAVATTPGSSNTPPDLSGADPVCAETENIMATSAQELKSSQNDPKAVAKTLNDIVDKLQAEKDKAVNPAVVSGLDALIADYQELSDDLKNSKAPSSNFLTKLTKDATQLTVACS